MEKSNTATNQYWVGTHGFKQKCKVRGLKFPQRHTEAHNHMQLNTGSHRVDEVQHLVSVLPTSLQSVLYLKKYHSAGKPFYTH